MQNMMNINDMNFNNNNFPMPNMMMNNNNFFPNNNYINFNMNNNNIFPGMNNNINNMMFNQNNKEEEEWLKGFKMGAEEANNLANEDNIPKMNVEFRTTNGISNIIIVKYGTTIDQLLIKYLNRVNSPELIGDKDNKIAFLFNADSYANGLTFTTPDALKEFVRNYYN